MDPSGGGVPQKSIFWSQKWHFPDFPCWGSVGGQGAATLNMAALILRIAALQNGID